MWIFSNWDIVFILQATADGDFLCGSHAVDSWQGGGVQKQNKNIVHKGGIGFQSVNPLDAGEKSQDYETRK